jgi:hypothetical protein
MITISSLFSALMELIPSDIIKIVKTAMLFAQWESRGCRISSVAKGSQ